MNFPEIGIQLPKILLPKEGSDLNKWAVIACDQYTSAPEVWDKIEQDIGELPSTFKLMLPEVYLNSPDKLERIEKINSTMKDYLEANILVEQNPSIIFCERKILNGTTRRGLIISVDLEKFDFSKTSKSLIRPTEGTIVDRIPPRLQIREKALIELPHIMLLIDDPKKSVIEPFIEISKKGEIKKVYDFDLMIKKNHLTGFKIEKSEHIKLITDALKGLLDVEEAKKKYDLPSDFDFAPLLFAVGDGNHSLATAKTHWENVKKNLSEEKIADHPARYALVEVVNLYDESLEFEPIHRVIFNLKDEKKFMEEMEIYMKKNNSNSEKVEIINFKTEEEMKKKIEEIKLKFENVHILPFFTQKTFGLCVVYDPKFTLQVATLQTFLDEFLKNPENKTEKTELDYIHGDEETVVFAKRSPQNIGFILPPMDKKDLFKSVILTGPTPRKTFSMGIADDKRVYLECKKIVA